MASEEHKKLAQYLKDVHSTLRKSSLEIGAEAAWSKHCENSAVLNKYANCMQKLACDYWKASETTSRIDWAANLCQEYFNTTIDKYRNRDLEIASKINMELSIEEQFESPYILLDIGSCYNPFKAYDYLEVLPIDLCPANHTVFQCDFLNVDIGPTYTVINNRVTQLQVNHFDVVTFCFVLEYIPSSDLRIKACTKAYDILRKGGLMIVTTPDSKHVGANAKIMKSWQYTLSCIGFTRIKYEKFDHMHCMAFRKATHKDIAKRWATLHKKDYMEFSLHIHQDKKEDANEVI